MSQQFGRPGAPQCEVPMCEDTRRAAEHAMYPISPRRLKRTAPDTTIIRMDYSQIITVEPDKRGGKPCIRGMRITVYDVLEYLASGMTPQDIIADFPELTVDDIGACLQFAADRERRLLSLPA